MKLSLVLIFAGILEICACARILFLIPIPSKSHFILGDRLAAEMAGRGHQVTIVSSYRRSKPLENLTEIVVPDFKDKLMSSAMGDKSTDGKFSMRHMNFMLFFMQDKMPQLITDEIMTHKPVKDLLNSNEKFDLVVGECFLQDALLGGFAHKFNAPLVAIATSMPNVWAYEMVGNPAPSAYIPDPFLGCTERMSFFDRLKNFLFTTTSHVLHYLLYIPSQDRSMREYFGNDLPPLKDIISNTSLVLVNHHYSLGFPRPYLPNMVEIGGYHVKPPKPLPQDLQKFMDEAKEGVIYFSMGSNLESSEFPEEKFQSFLKAFSRIKQRVLWKFENENPPNLPKNVKISKWLPQSDILAHPKVRLFITHGGLLSLTEATVRGVPVVGIPIFGDQPTNVKHVEKLGVGVRLEYDDITESSVFQAIQQVISDPKYSRNMKLRSSLLQDLPMSQIDTAIYWLEYVIRHRGAPHLRSAAQDLAWYQVYLLDVLAFVGVTLFAVFFLVSKCLCCLRRVFCGGRTTKVTSSKKKN